MTKPTKPYFGCSRKSWANRTWSSWVASITQTFVGEKNWCTSRTSGSWNALRTASWQMLNMLTSSSTLLDLLLTNREGLLNTTTTNGSLGYSDNNIVEIKILLSTLKTGSRTKTLNFRGADFNMLWAQMQWILWEASMEGKGACECWELLKSAWWKHKNGPSSLKRERKKAEEKTTVA